PSAISATKKVLHPALNSVRVPGSRPQPYPLALTTAAHSTGTVMLASVFQLASMAARSMVRTPRASVGPDAGGGTSAGRRSGSWTVITRGLWRGATRPSSAGAQSYERPWRALGNSGGPQPSRAGAGSRFQMRADLTLPVGA